MKFLKVLFIAFAVVLLIKLFAFTSCIIPFSGMENSLYEGERVIVNKWSYGLRSPFTCLLSYQRWWGKQVRRNDIVVFNNPLPQNPDKCITSREVFISRCTGIAGDTIFLNNQLAPITNQIQNPDYKSFYTYPKEQEDLLLKALSELNIKKNELISYRGEEFIRSFSRYELYLIRQKTGNKISFKPIEDGDEEEIFPLVVPRKGETIHLYKQNLSLLYNTIRFYERKDIEMKEDTLYIEGQAINSYTFTQDYYWMTSNNVINVNDSRLFGLVPETHIIGKANLIWFSKERNTGLFKGYRWNRFFQKVK